MAKTVYDMDKIYSEGWTPWTRDVFFYLSGVVRDGFGLMLDNRQAIAAATGWSLNRVNEAIAVLVGQEVLLPYRFGNVHYLAIRKWQDYQKRRFPSLRCPLPPREIFARLSRETRALILRKAGEVTTKTLRDVDVDVDVDSVTPLRSAPNPVEQAQAYYLERLRKLTRMEEPEFPFARAGAFFKKRFSKGDTVEDVVALIDYFFDHWIKADKSAAKFSMFQDNYNAFPRQLHP